MKRPIIWIECFSPLNGTNVIDKFSNQLHIILFDVNPCLQQVLQDLNLLSMTHAYWLANTFMRVNNCILTLIIMVIGSRRNRSSLVDIRWKIYSFFEIYQIQLPSLHIQHFDVLIWLQTLQNVLAIRIRNYLQTMWLLLNPTATMSHCCNILVKKLTQVGFHW